MTFGVLTQDTLKVLSHLNLCPATDANALNLFANPWVEKGKMLILMTFTSLQLH